MEFYFIEFRLQLCIGLTPYTKNFIVRDKAEFHLNKFWLQFCTDFHHATNLTVALMWWISSSTEFILKGHWPIGSVENINMRLFIYGYIFFIVLCGVQNGETVIFTQGDHLAGWNLSWKFSVFSVFELLAAKKRKLNIL